MVNHAERLKQMVENDWKRQRQIMRFALIFVIIIVALIYTINADTLLFLPIVLFGQLPLLYKGWHRMKLLLTFNRDAHYQQIVHREFALTIGNILFILLLVGSVILGWITLTTFIVAAVIGVIAFLAMVFWFNQRLKEIDPDHVKSMELSEAHQRYKKMVRK